MTINLGGLEIYYEKTGEGGFPLVMLHGNGEDGTIFEPLARKLSRHFTVYTIDSRNHGRSGCGELSYEAMAGDVILFIRELNLPRPYVVGFSDGAIIALLAELARPGLFPRMALAGANLRPSDFREEIFRGFERAYSQNGDPLLGLMLTEPDIDPFDLGKIDAPVFVIGAENDMFIPETFTTITDALPKARLTFMYGHDHGSYIVGSDLLYRPLLDFFIV
ncbi:MAG: alpha/beta hydrolase [Rikenellaceae bacterium]|nr:alpha/beta hydrolase [Rikenellaceae bacterium]